MYFHREWGWEIFQSIEKYCKHRFGYGHFPDVTNAKATAENNMESFFLGETLKYLYLLMDPDSEVDVLEKVSSSLKQIYNDVIFLYYLISKTNSMYSLLNEFFPSKHVFNTEAHPLRRFDVLDRLN